MVLVYHQQSGWCRQKNGARLSVQRYFILQMPPPNMRIGCTATSKN